jgi:hypothetical protein
MKMLKLFNSINEDRASDRTSRSLVGQAHKDLRAHGWKKSGYDLYQNHYTHPKHVGHHITVDSQTGDAQHTITYHDSLHQKGKGTEGRTNLFKHLNTHERQTEYSHSDAVSKAVQAAHRRS